MSDRRETKDVTKDETKDETKDRADRGDQRGDSEDGQGNVRDRESKDGETHGPVAPYVERAAKELSKLTNKSVDGVSAIVRADGKWRVTVELIELERIPESTSLLGTYEAEVDDDGNVVSFERIRRYHRNEGD
jgi:hypothetical protein